MPKALSIDRAVDSNLKPVKDSDGTITALEISTDNARIKNLEVLGDIRIGGDSVIAGNTNIAGEILGYTCIGADVADDSYTLTTSFVCFQDVSGNEINVSFKTPPSELVEIEVSLFFSAGSGASDLELSISDNSAYGSNGLHHIQQFEKTVCEPARGNGGTIVQKFLLRSNHLKAVGDSNTIYIAARCDSTSGTPIIRWGGDLTGKYTNLYMEAKALPLTIDGIFY
jgi:hypothetical protein